MLPLGRSVGEQIFACDEGVMGLHNDRRTGGKMSANDRRKVICFISLIYFAFILQACKRSYRLWSYLLSRISWSFFVLFLSHVHKVHTFGTCRKSTQAIRP